jgi:hypothetical protein
MQSMTIIEDGEGAGSLCVRGDGDVRVFDRTFSFRADISCAGTTWQILTRIALHIDLAELRAIEIERLAERCRTGWRPTSDAIDPDVPQRKLLEQVSAWPCSIIPTIRSSWSSAARRSS